MSSPELRSYLPFITVGFASLVGSDEKVQVKILRDTDDDDVASAVPYRPTWGLSFRCLMMMLFSDLFQGEVVVCICLVLPVDGVTIILGNDVVGSQVWADVAPPAIMVPTPLVSSESDRNETEFMDVFTACAVTHAMKHAQLDEINSAENDTLMS